MLAVERSNVFCNIEVSDPRSIDDVSASAAEADIRLESTELNDDVLIALDDPLLVATLLGVKRLSISITRGGMGANPEMAAIRGDPGGGARSRSRR